MIKRYRNWLDVCLIVMVFAIPAISADNKTPAAAGPDYVIGPEDVLNVSVWKEPEVSGVIPVRPDGKISLALIGDAQAAGLTPLELASKLRDSLSKFIDDPRVTIIVNAINSKRIYILGQINHPGAFPLVPQMTILQALSTAGGCAQFANTQKIYVLRKGSNGAQTKLPFNYKEVVRGLKTEQNVELLPGDTIVVP